MNYSYVNSLVRDEGYLNIEFPFDSFEMFWLETHQSLILFITEKVLFLTIYFQNTANFPMYLFIDYFPLRDESENEL